MKTSKVDHTKFAVGLVVNKNQERFTKGFLYGDSDLDSVLNQSEDMKKTLKDRINRLNSKARNLYNVFNPVEPGTAPTEPDDTATEWKKENYRAKKENYDRRVRAKKTTRDLNKELNKILFEVIQKERAKFRKLRDLDGIVKSITKSEYNMSADDVKDALLYLRRSLTPVKKSLEVLLGCFGKTSITEAEIEDIKKFKEFLEEDFYKTKEKENIIKSIENQNMPVQPADGLLEITGAKNDGIRNFLSKYADLDQEKRMGMLRKLRRIIDLFFSAPNESCDAVVEIPEAVITGEFDVFRRHEEGKTDETLFVPQPEFFIDAVKTGIRPDAVKKAEEKEKLAEDIWKRICCCRDYSDKILASDFAKDLFFDDPKINEFWVKHIAQATERILKRKTEDQPYRLELGYLREKVWKDALNYLSIKYISIGKALYYFVIASKLEEASETTGDKDYSALKSGLGNITIFDYELMKATETLQREISIETAFAVNNLARATLNLKEGKEDFLILKKNEIKDLKRPDILPSILQFFGGCSGWKKQMGLFGKTEDDKVKFLMDLQTILYSVRNESFHFATMGTNLEWDSERIGEMFKKELEDCVSQEKNAFYSNNLPLFYKTEDLKITLNHLYSQYYERASQVPAFGNVFVKKNFSSELSGELKWNPNFHEDTKRAQWQDAVYYLFKEIYYNGFIQDEKSRELFVTTIETNLKELESKPETKEIKCQINANKNFQKRINQFKNESLSTICQIIMTDYNMQNQKKRKVKTAESGLFDEEIYQHYKVLLLQYIREAFVSYVKENAKGNGWLSYLASPGTEKEKKMEEAEFLPGWSTKKYDELNEKISGGQKTNNKQLQARQLQRWYIVGRLLNSRSLNHLSGSIRSYIQCVEDIRRRANKTKNDIHIKTAIKPKDARSILEVLDFCMVLSSNFTNELTDYFADENDYANFLSGFVKFMPEGSCLPPSQELVSFCTENDWNGLYTDAKNPILNRNIVMAKMYSPYEVLKRLVGKVDINNIKEYKEAEAKISSYQKTGVCHSEKEQKKLNEYQRAKNIVELRNLTEYGELINELLGKLISWSYLRERDLMYYQLGFHYTCLKNQSDKPELYRHIETETGTINGAILYQIAAMYIHGLDIYDVNSELSNGKARVFGNSRNAGEGTRIKYFCQYSLDLTGSGEQFYNAGLELFENISEHDTIIDVRNAIDHFKYYQGNAGSILDLYSEVFDRFFTYNMNYKNNVVNVLENTMARHFVIMKFSFDKGTKKVDKKTSKTKDRAQIKVKEKETKSDKFTYKLKDHNKKALIFKLDARDRLYLETVEKIISG